VWDLAEWVHFEAIQAIVHHATAAVAAVFLFALTARLITYLMPAGHAKQVVIILDDVILLAVFALCGWRLMTYLWSGPREDSAHANPPAVQTASAVAGAPVLARSKRAKAMDECRAAAKNRADLRTCLQQKAAQAQQALDRAAPKVESAMQALDKVASAKIQAAQSFRSAEDAFVNYREAQCRWRAASAGSVTGDVYQACLTDLTRERVAQLEKTLSK
jgi:uncharacterized protein YecT (DUF1311 family)